MKAADRRGGFTFVDALMALGGLAVVVSLVFPVVERRAQEHRVARLVSDVEALQAAASQYRTQTGHWPPDGGPGRIPGELAPNLPADEELRAADYSLGWRLWNVVEVPPQPVTPTVNPNAPPPDGLPTHPASAADSLGTRPSVVVEMGSIVVTATETGLLGALLKQYGDSRSFVRDSTWTLVLGADTTR